MQAVVRRSRCLRFAPIAAALATALVAPAGASADVVGDWNRTLVDALVTTNAAPPNSGRLAATVEGAVYDATNGIVRRYTPLRVTAEAPHGGSPDAAALQAAYRTLSWAFPGLRADLDARRAASLAAIASADGRGPQSSSIQRGLAWGDAGPCQTHPDPPLDVGRRPNRPWDYDLDAPVSIIRRSAAPARARSVARARSMTDSSRGRRRPPSTRRAGRGLRAARRRDRRGRWRMTPRSPSVGVAVRR